MVLGRHRSRALGVGVEHRARPRLGAAELHRAHRSDSPDRGLDRGLGSRRRLALMARLARRLERRSAIGGAEALRRRAGRGRGRVVHLHGAAAERGGAVLRRLLAMIFPLAWLGCLLAAVPASAHSGQGIDPRWNCDLWVVLPLALSAGLYAQGVQNLWSRAGRGRGIRGIRVLAFAAGWLLLGAAVVSPLHAVGEQVLTAHMVEHEILMIAAAPLLAFSRPVGALLWALPRRWRSGLTALARFRPIARGWPFMTA